MTVPSMPMWSDWVASMPSMAPVRPRQKLPPPTTTATSTSSSWRSAMMSCAVASSVGPSMPRPPGPASASPDGLKTMRRQRGMIRSPSDAADIGGQPISIWANSVIVAEPISWAMDCLSSLAYGWSSRATVL